MYGSGSLQKSVDLGSGRRYERRDRDVGADLIVSLGGSDVLGAYAALHRKCVLTGFNKSRILEADGGEPPLTKGSMLALPEETGGMNARFIGAGLGSARLKRTEFTDRLEVDVFTFSA